MEVLGAGRDAGAQLPHLRGKRARGGSGPCPGSHSYHTPAFPPAGRAVLKTRSMCALPPEPVNPCEGPLRDGEGHASGLWGSFHRHSVLPDNRGSRAQRPAQGSDSGQPLKGRKTEEGYRQQPQAAARRNPQTRLTPTPVPAIAGTVG